MAYRGLSSLISHHASCAKAYWPSFFHETFAPARPCDWNAPSASLRLGNYLSSCPLARLPWPPWQGQTPLLDPLVAPYLLSCHFSYYAYYICILMGGFWLVSVFSVRLNFLRGSTIMSGLAYTYIPWKSIWRTVPDLIIEMRKYLLNELMSGSLSLFLTPVMLLLSLLPLLPICSFI